VSTGAVDAISRPCRSGEEVVAFLKEKLGPGLEESRVQQTAAGVKKTSFDTVWVRVKREALRQVVLALKEIQFPRLSVISAYDAGEEIVLIYHFGIQYGVRFSLIHVNIEVRLPKEDPKVDTIHDLIPGAVISEREKRELIGVEVDGLPPMENFFLPEDFPAGVHPWRKDESGIKH